MASGVMTPCFWWIVLSVLRVDSSLVRLQSELQKLSQVQVSFVQRQLVIGRPEIERIALDSAVWVQAAKDVLGPMDREAAVLGLVDCVQRTGTSQLLLSLEISETPQLAQHVFDRDLTAQSGIVDRRSLRGGGDSRLVAVFSWVDVAGLRNFDFIY